MNNKINVFVKKWFDDVNGNTYHNVNFNYNNKNYNSGLTYGYGSQYKTTLKDLLIKNNLINENIINNDYYKLRDFINDNFNCIVMDVNTEQELEKIDYFNQI
tara:strand:- start:365 stop:670 length:306 start_codon:yes stop_codon:yes gene_type:complete